MFQTEIKTAAWHETGAAKSYLSNLIDSPPEMVRAADDIMTGEPCWQYPRNDWRVAMLCGYANGHFVASGSLGLDVDTVITNAVNVYRAEQAELDRVAAYLNEGFTLGDARRMAADDLPIDTLEAR